MFIDPYLANITIFAGNFAPRGWAFCNGQIVSIAVNDALFALLGTTYGGDGVNTFALPDLRSRVAVGTGQGAGLSNYTLGEMGGSENVNLLTSNLPNHNHSFLSLSGAPGASTAAGTDPSPVNNVPAAVTNAIYTDVPDGVGMGVQTSVVATPVAGNSMPLPVLSPVLAMNYIICVEGIFPSRN